MDDELNVLPTSSLIRDIATLPTGIDRQGPATAVGKGCQHLCQGSELNPQQLPEDDCSSSAR
jgi:hypothetical protein